MKIALVSPYDFTHPGGVSEHVAHLRSEFQALGHDVTVMAPRSRKGGLEVTDDFVGVGRTVAIPGNGSTVRLTFDVTLYAAVKAMMRRERFDIVHVHEPLVPALPYMVLLNSDAVNVATFHAHGSSSGAWYTAFKPYMNLLMSRIDSRIAVSEPAREFVSQYFGGPYETIPNGIDIDRFGDPEPLPWAFDGRPRILFVGRFTEPRKGFKYLLRAMPLVQQQFPDARLVVVGTGKPEKFEGLMERYRVANVDFIGFVPPSELPRYYASCDVFCAPSIKGESFGIVLLEAMAAGTPVVASDLPGYRRLTDDGRAATLVPPGDAAALADALRAVLSRRPGPSSAVQHGTALAAACSIDLLAGHYEQIYRRVIPQSTTAGLTR